MAAVTVVHSGDDEAVTTACDLEVPVVQRLPPECGHVVDPALGPAKYSWLPVT